MFLCQVLTLIQLTYSITVTSGHIAGESNIYADAASRQFDHLTRDAAILVELEQRPRLPFPRSLIDDIAKLARTESSPTSNRVRSALTALDGVRGWSTRQQTSSVPSLVKKE